MSSAPQIPHLARLRGRLSDDSVRSMSVASTDGGDHPAAAHRGSHGSSYDEKDAPFQHYQHTWQQQQQQQQQQQGYALADAEDAAAGAEAHSHFLRARPYDGPGPSSPLHSSHSAPSLQRSSRAPQQQQEQEEPRQSQGYLPPGQHRRHPLQHQHQHQHQRQQRHHHAQHDDSAEHGDAYIALSMLPDASTGTRWSLYDDGGGGSPLQPLEDWARSVPVLDVVDGDEAFDEGQDEPPRRAHSPQQQQRQHPPYHQRQQHPQNRRPQHQQQHQHHQQHQHQHQQQHHSLQQPYPPQQPQQQRQPPQQQWAELRMGTAEAEALVAQGLDAAAQLAGDATLAHLPALSSRATGADDATDGGAPTEAVFPIAAWLTQMSNQHRQPPAKATVRVPSRAARVICSSTALLAHFERCTNVEVLTRCSEPKQSDANMTELLVRGTRDAVLHASSVLLDMGKALNEHDVQGGGVSATGVSAQKRAASHEPPHDGSHYRGPLRHSNEGSGGGDDDGASEDGRRDRDEDWTDAADVPLQPPPSQSPQPQDEREYERGRAQPQSHVPQQQQQQQQQQKQPEQQLSARHLHQVPAGSRGSTSRRSLSPLSVASQNSAGGTAYASHSPAPRSPLGGAGRWRWPSSTLPEGEAVHETLLEEDAELGTSDAGGPGPYNSRSTSPARRHVLARRRSSSLHAPAPADAAMRTAGGQLQVPPRRHSYDESPTAAHAATAARKAVLARLSRAEEADTAAEANAAAAAAGQGSGGKARQRAHVLVDNSNIFIGAQLNGNVRDLSIRVNIRALCQIVEGALPCVFRGVEGSNSGSGRIWREWSNNGYSVFLAGRRGERSSEATLMQRIQADTQDDVQDILVLVTGDGSESQASSSFTRLATAAATRGWQVHVWSWEQSLSGKFKDLKQRYSDNISILFLDKEKGQITFRAGQSGSGSGGTAAAKDGGGKPEGAGRRPRSKASSDPLPRGGRSRPQPQQGGSFDLGQLGQRQQQLQQQQQQFQQHHQQQVQQQPQFQPQPQPWHQRGQISAAPAQAQRVSLAANPPPPPSSQVIHRYGAPPSLPASSMAALGHPLQQQQQQQQQSSAMHDASTFGRALSLGSGTEYQESTAMGQILWGSAPASAIGSTSMSFAPHTAAPTSSSNPSYPSQAPDLLWAKNADDEW